MFRLTALSLIWFLWDVKETHTTVRKEEGTYSTVVWPTSPGLGGLSAVITHLHWSPALLCVPHHMVEVIK